MAIQPLLAAASVLAAMLVATRGRHPGWVALAAVGILGGASRSG